MYLSVFTVELLTSSQVAQLFRGVQGAPAGGVCRFRGGGGRRAGSANGAVTPARALPSVVTSFEGVVAQDHAVAAIRKP
jgi:hypothetical protein